MKYSFLLIIFAMMLFTCSKKVVKPENSNTKDSVSIVYSKTACYGRCPVYTMTIDKNGTVLFNGEKNVDKIGKYSLQLTPGEFDSLITAFEKTRFFELDSLYYKRVTDLPTTFITFTKGTKTKKITDYYGAPKRLKDLEGKIETIVDKEGWKKVD